MRTFQIIIFILAGQLFTWYVNFLLYGKIVFTSGFGFGGGIMIFVSIAGYMFYLDIIKDN